MNNEILLAPNGKPSNLTPEQYKLVRTPEFKAWFGDFENKNFIHGLVCDTSIVRLYESRGFEHEKRFKKEFNPKTINVSGIPIQIKKSSIKHIFIHSLRDVIFYSVFFLDEILKNAKLFDYEYNSKAKLRPNIKGYLCFISLVEFDGEQHVCRITVQEENDGDFILHDLNIVTKKSIENAVRDKTSNRAIQDAQNKDRKINLLYNTFDENISKVVDENGEPLVVYHYSKSDFNVFRTKGEIETISGKVENYGIYFASDESSREFYLKNKGEYEFECFIKITNPYLAYDYRWSSIINKERMSFLIKNNHDGVILQDGLLEYIALNSNQIKLADGTNTTFDGSNPDIRFKQGGTIPSDSANWTMPEWEIYLYAKKIKDKYPKVWALGGNIRGNQSFKELETVLKRGHWIDSERDFYVKWRSFVARHQHDFRIAGVIANLKWLVYPNIGKEAVKEVIGLEIAKKYPEKFNDGGEVILTQFSQQSESFQNEVMDKFLDALGKKSPLVVNMLSNNESYLYKGALVEFSPGYFYKVPAITIDSITVSDQQKGTGSMVMKDIIEIADKQGVYLMLYAYSFGAPGRQVPIEKLVNFYKKFGFKIDLEDAYGGDFESEKELMKYVSSTYGEGVPMSRLPETKKRKNVRK